MSVHASNLHRKLLERVILRSGTQSIKDVFRRYDHERTGVLTSDQFRTLMHDHDFVDVEVDLLVDFLGLKDHGNVSFHDFRGDIFLGTEQNYLSKRPISGRSPKKMQHLTQLPKNGSLETHITAKKGAILGVKSISEDPRETIRTKLCQRIMGHSQSIREVFVEYDIDGNGYLNLEEFRRFMTKYDFTLNETQIALDYLDRDASGTIDYDEFAAGLLFYRPSIVAPVQTISELLEPEKDQQPLPDTIRNIFTEALKQRRSESFDLKSEFDRYNVNGSNSLTHQELSALLVGLGISMKATEFRVLLQAIDPDESENIDLHTLSKLFYLDQNANGAEDVTHVDDRKFKHVSEEDADYYSTVGQQSQDDSRESKSQRTMDKTRGSDKEMMSIPNDNGDNDQSTSVSGEDKAPLNRNEGKEIGFDAVRRMIHGFGVKDSQELGSRESKSQLTMGKTHGSDKEMMSIPNDNGDNDQSTRVSGEDKAPLNRNDGKEIGYDAVRRMIHGFGVKDSQELDMLMNEIDKSRKRFINSNKNLHTNPREESSSKNTSERRVSKAGGDNIHTPSVKIHSQAENNRQINKNLQGREHDDPNDMGLELFRDFMSQYKIPDRSSISMLFERLDTDHSGTIDLDEFLAFFNAQRVARHKRGASKVVERGGQRQSIAIDGQDRRRSEYSYLSRKSSNIDPPRPSQAVRLQEHKEKLAQTAALAGQNSITSTFAAMDRQDDKKITRDTFQQLMNEFGFKDEDIAILTNELEVDSQGCIEYEDFASIFYESRETKRRDRNLSVSRKNRDFLPHIVSKNDQNARLRERLVKWMKQVLTRYDSIESAFSEYDKNGNGVLDHETFRHFMKQFGIVNTDDIDTLIRRLDTKKLGTISFETFLEYLNPLLVNVSKMVEGLSGEEILDPEELVSILKLEREIIQKMVDQTRDLRLAFRKLDTNGNGRVEYKEFRTVLKSYRVPEMKIRKVIRHLDRDVSGFIDYKEFLAIFGALNESNATIGTKFHRKAKRRVRRPVKPK